MISDILHVMTEIAEAIKKKDNVAILINSYAKNKYNINFLSALYSWVYEKINFNKSYKIKHKRSKRIFNEIEKTKIGLDNLNYLLHHFNIGLLTEDELNNIISELEEMPHEEINQELINTIILSLYLKMDQYTLPGSRFHLYSHDSIN